MDSFCKELKNTIPFPLIPKNCTKHMIIFNVYDSDPFPPSYDVWADVYVGTKLSFEFFKTYVSVLVFVYIISDVLIYWLQDELRNLYFTNEIIPLIDLTFVLTSNSLLCNFKPSVINESIYSIWIMHCYKIKEEILASMVH